MNEKQENLVGLTPDLIKLIAKVVRFSRGGFDNEERKELAHDLLVLVSRVMDGVVD